jgi:ADP-ribose pyrophosphatase YjhB (NUDIX family)
MSMYAPTLRRVVFLVCFDRKHRVALIRRNITGRPEQLALPAAQRGQREAYESAARRLMVRLAPIGALRPGDLVGYVEATWLPEATPRIRREARVFIAHVEGDEPGLWPNEDEAVIWHPYRQAAQEVAHLAIPELDLFLQGYVEGWIPSGWITLIPQP